jgi:hypothetical protein
MMDMQPLWTNSLIYPDELLDRILILEGSPDVSEQDELHELKRFRYQVTAGKNFAQCQPFIREDHFEDHTRDVAEENGLICDSWPLRCINWTKAADELRSAYTCAELAGRTFYFRREE